MTELKKIPRLNTYWYIVFVFFSIIGIVLAVNQLFSLGLFGFAPIDTTYFYLMLAFYLSGTFLIYPATSAGAGKKLPWYDALLFLVTVTAAIYLALHGLDIIELGWEYSAPLLPTVASVLLWVLVLEAVRRSTDFYMTLVCLFFGLYPLFAIYMPGFLQGQSYDFLTTARLHAMGRNGI
ncbi:MAG: TRAP transporter permease, partial [Deltaproteobacteria bacterium]|nr:TRAP transporter permease [Deltaproteobacteria bacterium]